MRLTGEKRPAAAAAAAAALVVDCKAPAASFAPSVADCFALILLLLPLC